MTHVGLVRSNNEDSFSTDSGAGLFVVADGMGGARGGERASRITVDTVVDEMKRADGSADRLAESIRVANRNVRREADQNRRYAGMGTTVVAVLVNETHAYVANVGDSRAYLRADEEFYCVTTDHTWVNEVGRGLGLSDEQLRMHPYRNVLTKAVGAEDEIEVETRVIGFSPQNLIMLCSDGLHTVVGEEALARNLGTGGSLKEKCAALIDSAINKGAPDNVTVVLIEQF